MKAPPSALLLQGQGTGSGQKKDAAHIRKRGEGFPMGQDYAASLTASSSPCGVALHQLPGTLRLCIFTPPSCLTCCHSSACSGAVGLGPGH